MRSVDASWGRSAARCEKKIEKKSHNCQENAYREKRRQFGGPMRAPGSLPYPLLMKLIFFILAAAFPFSTQAQSTTTLVPLQSVWKYLDNGSNQGTAWRAPAFDDTSWAQGPGELGYGDGGEATIVSYG